MRKKHNWHIAIIRLKFCSLALGVIALGGCQSDEVLKATGEYARFAKKANEVFPVIQQDIVASCIRTASLRAFENEAETADLASRRDNAILRCRQREGVTAQAMADIHAQILLYLNALAGLATDKSISTQIVALGEAVKTLPGLNADEAQQTIDAGTTLTSVISKYLTRAYRTSKTREAIIQSDEPLSKLVFALSTATYYGYIGARKADNNLVDTQQQGPGLSRENFLLSQYYGGPIRESMRSLPRQPYQGYIEVTLNNKWLEEQAKIDQRREFAANYLRLLKDIACDHTQLRLLVEKRTDKKPSDVNTYCDSSSTLGLPLAAGLDAAKTTVEARMIMRLSQYRERFKALALHFDHVMNIR